MTDCNDLARVVVDTTVQPKAVMFPTDAKLVNRARERLVRLAKKLGVTCLAFIKPKPKFRNLSFCESDSPIRSKPSEFKSCLTECFLETTLNWLDQLKARRITQPMKGQRILPAFVKRS